MTTGMPAQPAAKSSADPATVVVDCLRALADYDLDSALALVAEDLTYTNVSLPTIHGRDRVETMARQILQPGRLGFKVHFNYVMTDGDVVLTDRIDELNFKRFASRFWVYGRFVVRDGQISVWRDSFDWLDVTIGNLRGLIGLFAPAFNRTMPSD
jgi:limonene-1,2-epoxide hydrolase